MNTIQLNQGLMLKVWVLISAVVIFSSPSHAQSIDQVRWKSESQVRALYGEPKSISSPVGTHASYTMWKYDDFTVAFANNKAFHLFKKDSLRKIVIEENRDNF